MPALRTERPTDAPYSGSFAGRGSVRASMVDNRLFEEVLHRYRAGIPQRELPERFRRGKNLRRRFSRSSKAVCGFPPAWPLTPPANMRWSHRHARVKHDGAHAARTIRQALGPQKAH